jgi:hypothetical protein
MADRITITDSNGLPADVSVDDLDTLNGVATDVHVQRFKAVFGSDGVGQDVDATHPLPVAVAGTLQTQAARGTFGYDAGTAATTVDVPAGAHLRSISVIPGAGTATVAIAGGDTITIPQGGAFDERIDDDTPAGADVVIGGTVASYYVSWAA